MCMIMAGQRASARAAVVRNRRTSVLPDHTRIEVHQPLARQIGSTRPHPVRSVADRAAESIVDVPRVLCPTRVIGNLILQIVAFGAKRVRPVHAEIRIGKQVRDRLPWRWRLAEFVPPLQQMRPL